MPINLQSHTADALSHSNHVILARAHPNIPNQFGKLGRRRADGNEEEEKKTTKQNKKQNKEDNTEKNRSQTTAQFTEQKPTTTCLINGLR